MESRANVIQPHDTLVSVERAQIGRMPLLVGGFGRYVTQEDFIASIPADEPDRSQVVEMIENTGFTGSFRSNSELNLDDPVYDERMAYAGARAAVDVIERHGWDSVDHLILGSSSSKMRVLSMIIDELRSAGIIVDNAQVYSFACDSVVAAINDLCGNSELHGCRAAVIGIEQLTGRVGTRDHRRDWTFGNVVGGLAFKPGEELVRMTNRATILDQDTEGVIKVPDAFGLQLKGDRGDPVKLPHGYVFAEGTDQSFFEATKEGLFLDLLSDSEEGFGMDGSATYKYFAKRVPPEIVAMYQEYYKQYASVYGPLEIVVTHQPSAPVHKGIMRSVEKRIGRLQKQESMEGFVLPEAPWVMDKLEIGLNNGSAATIMAPFTHLTAQGLIHLGKPFGLVGYGIGSAITANVFCTNKLT